LLALPAPKRGRPPKSSTLELQRLLAELGSKRGAARAVSGKTGESFHTLRRRLRSKESRKPKRKGGT
jgi:DNA invertase Pin-like site-specific DNA recombinase